MSWGHSIMNDLAFSLEVLVLFGETDTSGALPAVPFVVISEMEPLMFQRIIDFLK